jgi:hypothetical protein
VIIDTGLTRDTLVRGFDFRPDPRVTRAAFLSVAGTDRYLGGWTPWQSSTELPSGVAVKIPARAQIAVRHPLCGRRAAGDRHTATRPLLRARRNRRARHDVHASSRRASDARTPGRVVAELKIRATTNAAVVAARAEAWRPVARDQALHPDGSSDVVLWVKDFRQDWQTPYVFAKPVALPAGSVVQAIAYFDASPSSSTARRSRSR